MAVAHGGNARVPATTSTATGSVNLGSYTPTGTPAGIVVILQGPAAGPLCTGVNYGTVPMALTTFIDDPTEPSRVEAWTLSNQAIPAGAQNINLTGATATAKWSTVANVTSATNLAVIDTQGTAVSVSAANPQVTIATTASTTTMTYAGVRSGNLSVLTTGLTGCTHIDSNDDGALVGMSLRRTAVDSGGNVTIGYSFATADDYGVAAVAFRELAALTSGLAWAEKQHGTRRHAWPMPRAVYR